jgi:hypothetical protein
LRWRFPFERIYVLDVEVKLVKVVRPTSANHWDAETNGDASFKIDPVVGKGVIRDQKT